MRSESENAVVYPFVVIHTIYTEQRLNGSTARGQAPRSRISTAPVRLGLGRSVTVHHRSSTSYQIREHNMLVNLV
jgi:hypothetical protein